MYPQMVQDLKFAIDSNTSLLLTRVSHYLTEQGIPSYLTGGFVRDTLLGRETSDIDITVGADALEVAPEVAKTTGGKYVLLDDINRIGRVVLDNRATKGKRQIDFSSFQDNIEVDLARRDFTIDAMAVDLAEMVNQPDSSILIDPFKGQDDLDNGVVRAVSEGAFLSDAARLLRAVRIAVELDFNIESGTEDMIQQHAHLITNVAGERVREELLKLLALPRAGQWLAYLDRLNLLDALIPELADAKEVEQPKEHFWDVFVHSIKTVVAVEFLLRQGTWEYDAEEVLAAVPWSAELEQHFNREVSSGSTRESILKLAALFHDIAKPQTKTIEESGRMRFLGHAKEGAVATTVILERLRFSSKEIKLVENLVRYHLRPTQMSQEELPSNRAIYRYFRDAGEDGIDILFLSLADHLASRGKCLDLAPWREHTRLVEYVLAKYFEEESVTVPLKLIDGHDLINNFSLSPGPKIGEILEAVREAQASGEVTTKQEALALAGLLLTSPPSKG
ncbi:MAG: HD domain-containing protein [Dehalococcoidales bacterium]